MAELDAIERLAAAARGEAAPTTDVADRVLERIRHRQASRRTPLAYVAMVSAAAAAAVLVFAAQAWITWNDPLVELFSQITLVTQ